MTQPQGGEGEELSSGCRWCGFGEQFHGTRTSQSGGEHTYTAPTSREIARRAQARIAHRAALRAASRVRQVGQQQ